MRHCLCVEVIIVYSKGTIYGVLHLCRYTVAMFNDDGDNCGV